MINLLNTDKIPVLFRSRGYKTSLIQNSAWNPLTQGTQLALRNYNQQGATHISLGLTPPPTTEEEKKTEILARLRAAPPPKSDLVAPDERNWVIYDVGLVRTGSQL